MGTVRSGAWGQRLWTLGLGLAMGALAPSWGVAAPTDLVVMPGADLVVYANLRGMRDAAMAKKFEQLSDLRKELAGPDREDAMGDFENFRKKLEEVTDLKSEDMLAFRGAAKLDNVRPGVKPTPDDLANAELTFGFELAKPLSVDSLMQAMKAAAATKQQDIQFSSSEYHGMKILGVTPPDEDGGPPMFFTMAPGDRVMLGGTEVGLKGALDRLKGGAAAVDTGFAGDLSTAVKSADMYMLFAPTSAMSQWLRDEAESKAGAQPNSLQANVAKAMQGLRGIGLAVNMKEKLDVALVAGLGSDADAQQIKTILDTTVLSMVNLYAAMMTGGQPLPFVQSLKTTTGPGSLVTLGFSMTPGDVDALAAVVRRQAADRAEQMAVPPDPENETD